MTQDTDASLSFYDSGSSGHAGQNSTGTVQHSTTAMHHNTGTGQNRSTPHAGTSQTGTSQTGINPAGLRNTRAAGEVLADELTFLTRPGETRPGQPKSGQPGLGQPNPGETDSGIAQKGQNQWEGKSGPTASEGRAGDTRDSASDAGPTASEGTPGEDMAGWYVPETPDGYNFTLPSDIEVDERAADQFRDLAHAEGITQGQAQSVAGLYARLVARQQNDQAEALVETESHWLSELRSDRSFPQTVAKARLAMQRYGTPELENLLNDTRLGSHPALVRFVARIGRELAEPDTMPARSTRASQGLNFYDTMR